MSSSEFITFSFFLAAGGGKKEVGGGEKTSQARQTASGESSKRTANCHKRLSCNSSTVQLAKVLVVFNVLFARRRKMKNKGVKIKKK